MGKTRLIAETGAGQHGVATATAAALMGMECVVFHGQGGHHPPSAECLPHAPSRRDGRARQLWYRHAQGRRVRSHARVDDAHQRHALLPRLRHGATPLPPPSYAISSLSSQARASSRCSKRKDVCPMPWSRASAAARTPSAAFTISSTTLLCASSVLRPRAAASTRLRPPQPSRPAGSASSTA